MPKLTSDALTFKSENLLISKNAGYLDENVFNSSKVAIMQPYFFPYIGYFDLIASCNIFVVYDDAAYSKNSWYNRNRILSKNKNWEYIRVSVRNVSLGTSCKNVQLASKKIDLDRINALMQCYSRAPFFHQVMEIIEHVFKFSDESLNDISTQSIVEVCKYIGLPHNFVFASALEYDRQGSAIGKVIDICKIFKATDYVNLTGGRDIYEPKIFEEDGFNLNFTPTTDFSYAVEGFNFVSNLSIIDVLMWCSPESVLSYLNSRKLT
jgi:hypothetical protein